MQLTTIPRRLVTAAATLAVMAASGGVSAGLLWGSPARAASPAATCQSNEQPLGFGLKGTIKITVCPTNDINGWDVLVMTKDDGTVILPGRTRVTSSDGSSYTGAWHYDGGQGFNEGLHVPGGTPLGRQYCGQFFYQPDQSQPVQTTSIPICLTSA